MYRVLFLRFCVGSQFCQINWSSPEWHSVFFSFICFTWIFCALLCFVYAIDIDIYMLWPIRITSLSIWFHFMFKLKINTIFGRLFVQPENWNDDSKLVITYREGERMKKTATDIIFYVYLVFVRIYTCVIYCVCMPCMSVCVCVCFRVFHNMYHAIKMFVGCLWHKLKSEYRNKRSHTHKYTHSIHSCMYPHPNLIQICLFSEGELEWKNWNKHEAKAEHSKWIHDWLMLWLLLPLLLLHSFLSCSLALFHSIQFRLSVPVSGSL